MNQELTTAPAAGVQSFVDAVNAASRPKCLRSPYNPMNVAPLDVAGPFVAYASPDSAFSVVKQKLNDAQQTILIGMYDFTATYVADLLTAAVARGVQVTMMLDLAPDQPSHALFNSLQSAGVNIVLAPTCRNGSAAHFFPVAHEKVIVIDGIWTLVQSGNFTEGSLPPNSGDGVLTADFHGGYRDMGVAVQSKDLAAFFTALLQGDMQKEESAEAGGLAPPAVLPVPALVLAAQPLQPPPRLFPSQQFQPAAPVSVTPVLSPDNYVSVITGLLSSAESSIYMEQQYIHGQEASVSTLCGAIQAAMSDHPGLDVRIVLAPPFNGEAASAAELQKDLDTLATTFNLQTGPQVRLLNHAFFSHLHNKLIIVDGKAVLISSENWSTPGVSENREAGLLIPYPDLAAYYTSIFLSDWESGVQNLAAAPPAPALVTVPAVAPPAAPPPGTVSKPAIAEQLVAAAPAGAPGRPRPVRIHPGDYADV